MTDPDWFEVRRFPHGVTMVREPYHSEDVKVYLVEGERDVAVLDTGLGVSDFAGLVASLSSRRPRVLQTHAHWDHIGASHRFAEVLVHATEVDGLARGLPEDRYRAAFAPGSVDQSRLPAGFDPAGGLPGCHATGVLNHGDRIDLGGRELEVFHTPGHSPGGVSFLDRRAQALFVGDLLYLGRMYIFFPNSDPMAFRQSLRLAADLAPMVDMVYPAHEATPLAPDVVFAIRDAYEEVCSGREPDRPGSLFGFDLSIHDFGQFSFLMPAGDWRGELRTPTR
jgi:glyoxylase-like metal-dependent hydrolase (beta-lactamase superfamily II)